ncbi:MAG: hypothetical protein JNJ73_00080 [Hyphomonadaceae bacterium]|nr:hypothetical protein [Hyphomonadaceae bacterium]
MSDDFFIGWAPTPEPDRRFLLRAALGLVAIGAGAGGLLASQQAPPGPGQWKQGEVRTWRGLLVREPYPALRTLDLDGSPRTAFLATSGKLGVQGRLTNEMCGAVAVRGSLIARGRHAMIAVPDGDDWITLASASEPDLAEMREEDLGEVLLVGEILDSKCWFGAMRPGQGKPHKSCASLCLRGGLPAAFCAGPNCGEGSEAPLFLDAQGRAHGHELLSLAADPVRALGRLVRVGDVTQFRADLSNVARL